jgi:hypothetical protein
MGLIMTALAPVIKIVLNVIVKMMAPKIVLYVMAVRTLPPQKTFQKTVNPSMLLLVHTRPTLQEQD